MSFPRITFRILILIALAGCDRSSDPTAGSVAAPVIQYADGDGQTGRPGEPLPQPLVVHVGDGTRDLRNFEVSWTITSGQGSFVGPSTTRTDDEGVTSIRFVPATHRATVRASAYTAKESVDFKVIPEPKALYSTAQTAGPTCEEWCARYTFYPDATFNLVYPAGAAFPGAWVRQNDVLLLNFDVDSGWQARATIRGTELEVRYNAGMNQSDFEDATFELVRGGPVPDWLPSGSAHSTTKVISRP